MGRTPYRLPDTLTASLERAFAGEVAERLPRLLAAADRLGDHANGAAAVGQVVADAHALASSAAVVGADLAALAARECELLLIPYTERGDVPSAIADRAAGAADAVRHRAVRLDGSATSIGTDMTRAAADPSVAITVLVVDDSPVHRRFLRAAIDADPAFCVVGEARTGREAVALVERLRPAIVLMDLDLPVMNGIEAIERIMAGRPDPDRRLLGIRRRRRQPERAGRDRRRRRRHRRQTVAG